MKKIVSMMCVIFCLSFFSFGFSVQAIEDGALKINTNIQTTPQSSDIHYIEQENDLSALFRMETTVNIEKQQDKTKKEEQEDKQNLFIKPHSSQRLVDIYTAELFHANRVSLPTDNQQITLNTASLSLSVPMILMLLIAGVMMVYSFVRVIISKKG